MPRAVMVRRAGSPLQLDGRGGCTQSARHRPTHSHFKSTWAKHEFCRQEQALDEPLEPGLIAGGEAHPSSKAQTFFFKVPKQFMAIKDNKRKIEKEQLSDLSRKIWFAPGQQISIVIWEPEMQCTCFKLESFPQPPQLILQYVSIKANLPDPVA